MRKFKIGDVVTGVNLGQWLKHYYAKIVGFDKDGKAVLEKLKNLDGDDQWRSDVHWSLDSLKLVEDFKVEQLKNNSKEGDNMGNKSNAEFKVGNRFRVIKNRNSTYGRCSDIIEIEGKIVEIYKIVSSKEFRIKDQSGNMHACEECNLEPIEDKIEIIFDERKTIAKFPSGKCGIAICNSNEMNTYSKLEGSRIAIARLLGEDPFVKFEEKQVLTAKDFKVGDRIIVVNDVHRFSSEIKKGDMGTIEKVKDNELIIMFDKFKSDRDIQVISFTYDSIEIVKDAIGFKVGDKVKLIVKETEKPVYGWGSVEPGEIGKITLIADNRITVKFPSQNSWDGIASEFELVESEITYDKELWNKFTTCEYGVYCKSEEEANKFLEFCESKDLIWFSGSKPTELNHFSSKGNGSTYLCRDGETLTYSEGKVQNGKVITYDELFKLSSSESLKKEEFKVGDYICYDICGKFNICKIEKIENNKLWGYFSKKLIRVLPTTIKEFESIEKNTDMTYLTINNSTLKKLDLIEESVPKFEVGQVITKEQAIKVIKDGGVVQSSGWLDKLYFEEDGVLKFKTENGSIEKSTGYSGNLNRDVKFISYTKEVLGLQPEQLQINQKLWNDFLEGKVTVKCNTEKEDVDFRTYCEKEGLMWASGSKPTSHTYFNEKTGYVYESSKKDKCIYGRSETSNTVNFIELFTPEIIEEVEEEFKVGDYIALKDYNNLYDVCQIERIEGTKLYGHWADGFKTIPKTLKEFQSKAKNQSEQFINKDSAIKLSFEEDKPEYEVGQPVNKEEAIDIIEKGGKIERASGFNKLVYYKEDGVLYYNNGIDRLKSGGYDKNFAEVHTYKIIELPKRETTHTPTNEISEEVMNKIVERVIEKMRKGIVSFS